MRAPIQARGGATLVELLVVIAILAITTALVGLALRPAKGDAAVDVASQVTGARRLAAESGRPVRLMLAVGADSIAVLAQPDGSILGAPPELIDRASGRPPHAPR